MSNTDTMYTLYASTYLQEHIVELDAALDEVLEVHAIRGRRYQRGIVHRWRGRGGFGTTVARALTARGVLDRGVDRVVGVAGRRGGLCAVLGEGCGERQILLAAARGSALACSHDAEVVRGALSKAVKQIKHKCKENNSTMRS